MVKNLPEMQETWVQSLGWDDPLEIGMATHSSILAWRMPWTEKPGGLQSMRLHRVGHDWVTNTFPFQPFLAPGTGLMEDNFFTDWGGWFQDDSSILRLLCALFILLSHQLHLRSSGIRSWKLGTPVLWHLQFLKNPEYHLPTPVMVSIYLFIPGTSHLPWPEPSPSTHASPYWLWGKREQTRASCQHCGGFSVWPGQPQRPIPWQTRAEAQAMRWGLLNLSLRSASPEHSPWSYCWCSLLAAFWCWCRHGAWAPYEEGLQGCEVGHGQRRAERCEVRRVLAKAQFQKGGKSPDLQGPCLTCWPPPHSPGAFSSASMKVSSSWQMLQ